MGDRYTKALENKQSELESLYLSARLSNDSEESYNILGKMMDYKVIDLERLNKELNINLKKAIKDGILEKDNLFSYDLRKSVDYIPKWVYMDLEESSILEVTKLEKWGTRIEGNYAGDMIFPERQISIEFKLLRHPKMIENAISEMKSLMNSDMIHFKDIDRNELNKIHDFGANLLKSRKKLLNGEIAVYDIVVKSEMNHKYKMLGYAFCINNGRNIVKFELNYKSMKESFIDIKGTYRAIKDNFSTVDDVIPISNINLHISDQKQIVKNNRVYGNSIKEESRNNERIERIEKEKKEIEKERERKAKQKDKQNKCEKQKIS